MRGSLFLLRWLVGRAVVQGLFSILAARTLGAADFGAFGAALSLAGGITPWLGFGLTTAMVQRIAAGATHPQREFATCLRWYLWTYPALTAIGLGLVQILLPAVRLPASVVIIAEMSSGFVEPVMRLAQATQDFNRMGRLTLGLSASRLLAVAVAWGASWGSLDRFCWCYLLTSIAYTAVLLSTPLKALGAGIAERLSNPLRPAAGIPFSVMASTFKLNVDFDKTALVWSGQNGVAGNYSAAYRLTDLACIPLVSVIETSVPDLFAAGSAGRQLLMRKLLGKARLLLPLALLCGAAIYVMAPASLWLYGTRYPEVPAMLRYLCPLPLVFSIWLLIRTAATAAGQKLWCMGVECCTTSLSIAALLIAIPKGSWLAAVAITYISYLCMAALYSIGLFRARAQA